MHMNWLEISIGIVFLICIITGLVRGAVRIMVSLDSDDCDACDRFLCNAVCVADNRKIYAAG